MTTRRFLVRGQVELTIELDQAVFDNVDDDFRKHLYDLRTDDDVVEMIGHSVVVLGNRRLTSLDGWANLDNAMLGVSGQEFVDIEVEELEANDEHSD
jgi:hypothetical protein